MTTFKTLLFAFVFVLSISSTSFSSQTSLKSFSFTKAKSNYDAYVYIKDVLYHIIYDEDGNIILMDEVDD